MFDHIIQFYQLSPSDSSAGQAALSQPIYLIYPTLLSYFFSASSLIPLVHTEP